MDVLVDVDVDGSTSHSPKFRENELLVLCERFSLAPYAAKYVVGCFKDNRLSLDFESDEKELKTVSDITTDLWQRLDFREKVES